MDCLKYEGARLATFHHYNGSLKNALASKLARCGFYYTGVGESAECATCGLHLNMCSFQNTDEIKSLHRLTNPTCILKDGENNFPMVPINGTGQAYNVSQPSSDSESNNTNLDSINASSNEINLPEEKNQNVSINASTGDISSQHKHPTMEDAPSRIRTYVSWPHSKSHTLNVEEMTDAGFFYTGYGDSVTCFHCGGKIRCWESYHDPINEHIKHFPTCEFAQSLVGKYGASTRPKEPVMKDVTSRIRTYVKWPHIKSATLNAKQMALAGFFYLGYADEVRCFHCGVRLRSWRPSDDPVAEHIKSFPHCEFAQSLITKCDSQPKHPIMGDVRARIESYTKWPRCTTHTPTRMAEAGFYYVGYCDCVRCFHCDGGLRNWFPEDDPVTEHYRIFPRCDFIQSIVREQNRKGAAVQITCHNEESSSSSENRTPNEKNHDFCRNHSDIIIKTCTTNSVVFTVLDIGFPHEIVRRALEAKSVSTEHKFSTAEALIHAILDIEDANNSSEETILQTFDRNTDSNDNLSGETIPPTLDHIVNSNNKSLDMGEKIISPSINHNSNMEKKIAELTEETKTLRKKNTELLDLKQCKVCMDAHANIALVPCGHIACCLQCSNELKKCLLCRTKIKHRLKIYT